MAHNFFFLLLPVDQSSAVVDTVAKQDHRFAVGNNFVALEGLNNFVELDHSFVWVDNLVMLDHSSVGVDNAVMLDHSFAGVENAAMLNQSGYLVVVGQCFVVEECVMLGHGSVEVENFVEVHSFYHPLAWNPDCCKRDSLDC